MTPPSIRGALSVLAMLVFVRQGPASVITDEGFLRTKEISASTGPSRLANIRNADCPDNSVSIGKKPLRARASVQSLSAFVHGMVKAVRYPKISFETGGPR